MIWLNYSTDEWVYSISSSGEVALTNYLRECPAELEIPDKIDGRSVTILGKRLFREQKTLRRVKFPKELKIIEGDVFYECTGLTIYSTDLPETLTQIGNMAFWDCNLMCDTSSGTDGDGVFTFPPCCERIGQGAFFGTSAIALEVPSRLVLPSTIKKLGRCAFSGSSFRYVCCDCDLSGSCFRSCDKLEKAIVSRDICNSAFDQCESLKDVELKEGVTNIDRYSFARTAIENIAFPKSLKTIREGAFWDCKALESTSFEGTASIDEMAFYKASIRKVGLPPKMQGAIDNGKKLNKGQTAFVKALVNNGVKDYSLLMALANTL